MDLSRDEWLAALEMDARDIPDLVVIEGSWWRAQRTAWRTSALTDVRELKFPDMFHGRVGDAPVLYSCVYGASRAVELAHLFSLLGSEHIVVIGTCGALDPTMQTGDVVVPRRAVPREGVARLYGYEDLVTADSTLSNRLESDLTSRGLAVFDPLHLTWSSIFAQSGAMISDWQALGYGSVDMETATAFAAARHHGTRAAAMLVVWDQLDEDRSFLDELDSDGERRLDRANREVFEVALGLAMS